MVSKILSGALVGIDSYIVDVETDISSGLPRFDLVGLPDSSVKESKERVRAAITNSGLQFPIKRITVNLAPADTKKEGPSFDLPIALAILSCSGIITARSTFDTIFIGELSLDGTIRGVNGVLPIVYGAAKSGIKKCIVPFDNAEEGALVSGIEVIGVKNLSESVKYLNRQISISPTHVDIQKFFDVTNESDGLLNFSDVKGQESVKRALEVSATGNHNILMIGPPGSGKTMMARLIPTILSDLTFEESLEITKIYSVSGLLNKKNCLVNKKPFRSPHHTISAAALTGGGRIPRPGEISLSHNGVLFLDELPEFPKNVLESLRQPLEDKKVTISRVNGNITYPSEFMLIASMNPCPCGYLGNPNRCHCSSEEVYRYLHKISGPLLDRIDIHIQAANVSFGEITTDIPAETSQTIKQRVVAARNIQTKRYKNESFLYNSQLNPTTIKKYCHLGKDETDLLKAAFEKLDLSARAYDKILKISRTIADLDSSENILIQHLSEAIRYRSLDRKYWR